ncbi:hypothetical protein C8R46DRAFT_904258 [Mycena filopes]|nr:hypothetical protein C8R46DRAFT_904258 [Mycena filopes]
MAQASSLNDHALHHRGLAERIRVAPPVGLADKAPSRKIHRRRSCNAPGVSSTSTTLIVASSTAVKTFTTAEAKTTSLATTTEETSTTVKHTTATAAHTTAASVGGTTSSSGGHKFTLTNKCSSPVNPVVVSTACGYSPRCADAATAAMPSPGSLAAGKTTTISIPNNFVGRIFAQDGSCGTKGESCTMLEFNLDADSFYTPNSYDISNIQGFTQSISLGASGCSTVTCTSSNCGCENAYPIGDMTGCGNDLPVKACGKGPVAFDVVFCP